MTVILSRPQLLTNDDPVRICTDRWFSARLQYLQCLTHWRYSSLELNQLYVHSAARTVCIWVRSQNCDCLVTWFYKAATVPWPDPYFMGCTAVSSHPPVSSSYTMFFIWKSPWHSVMFISISFVVSIISLYSANNSSFGTRTFWYLLKYA